MHPSLTGFLTSTVIVATLGISDVPTWVAVITGASALFGLSALRATAFAWRGERNVEKVKADRLEQELAAEVASHNVTRQKLEVAEKKPDIDKLYEFMRDHDTRTAQATAELAKALAETSANIASNTRALQLWATQQAKQDFGVEPGGTR